MQEDYIIVLAWPEGEVVAAGSWYDKLFANKGKYRVGHSAIILVEKKTGETNYFDFGRYHTPVGFGRVRDKETDPDVELQKLQIKENKILNIEEFLIAVSNMKSTHGKGKLYASILTNIDFQKAYCYAKNTQEKGMLKYGPFIKEGTNCSRFSASVIRKGNPKKIKKLRLRFPFCLSPSPKRNISICNNNYYIIENSNCKKINKNKLHAYFSSIEL